MSNQNNYYNERMLGERGHSTGSAANAEGYRKYQAAEAAKAEENRRWWSDFSEKNFSAPKPAPAAAPARKKSKEEDGEFSWFGAVLGFLFTFGHIMNEPEADPVVAGILGIIAGAVLGKIFKFLVWLTVIAFILFVIFGGEGAIQ